MNKLLPEEFKYFSSQKASEIAVKLIGRPLSLPNGWGDAIVVGAWKSEGAPRVLLAWPNAENPKNLFNERLEDLMAPSL